MPQVGGYDVTLGTFRLKLERDRVGALALRFLDSPDEPGLRGTVRTIEFDNLHHGLGGELAIQADRYTDCDEWSPFRPGRIELLGDTDNIEDVDNAPSQETGACETTKVFATSFQWQGSVYFILPSKVIKWDEPDSTWDEAKAAGTGENFRGPAAFYWGKWYWGLEDDDGKSIGCVVLDTLDDSITIHKTSLDATRISASLFFSVHSYMWALENTYAATRKGEAVWRLLFTDAADASLVANYTAAMEDKHHPYPTAIYPFGRWVLVFGANGEALAVSETPPIKSLIPPGLVGSDDPEFGVGCRQWRGHLLVPSRTGLWGIPFDGIDLKSFNPHTLQGPIGKDIRRPSVITPYGQDVLVGTRSNPNSPYTAHIGVLRDYPEGIIYNEVLSRELFSTGPNVLRAMEVMSTGRVAMLIGNATAGRIKVMGVPPVAGGRPPTNPGLAAGLSDLTTAWTYGPSRGRKLFTQIRGWAEGFPPNGTMSITVSVDKAAFQTMATITAAGPFTGTTIKPIGRAIAIRPSCNVTTDGGSEWPVFLLPIFVDYVEEPAGGFRIEMDIEAGGGPRRGGRATQAREAFLVSLQALIGTTATLTLLESGTAYTVFVEQVEAVDREPPTGRERPQSMIRLAGKVV